MTRVLTILAVTFLLAASAHAQSSDQTASTLPLEPGEKVIVTRITTRETLRGRVVRVLDEGLELDNGPTRQLVPFGELDRIERPKDRIWNGALIGYGVGFATGVAMVLSDSCRPQPGVIFNLCLDGPEFALGVGGLITGPIGMGVGAIWDALVRKPHVVFDRRSPTRVAAAPTLMRRGAGFRVAVAF